MIRSVVVFRLALFLALCVCWPTVLRAQDVCFFDGNYDPLVGRRPRPELVEEIESDWKLRFKASESERDFSLLSEYRKEKQTWLTDRRAVSEAQQRLAQDAQTYADALQTCHQALNSSIENARGDSLDMQFYLPSSFDAFIGAPTPGFVPIAGLRNLLPRIQREDSIALANLDGIRTSAAVAAANVATVEEDLRQAEATIDLALDPEHRDIDFRLGISTAFSVLIAVMIISFFTVIYLRAPESAGSLLLSDSGLQFVTIFVLIIAIILFGILNILEGRELAAILSGIAGYILGRGTQQPRRSTDEAGRARPETPGHDATAPGPVHAPALAGAGGAPSGNGQPALEPARIAAAPASENRPVLT